ncbi:TPA: Nuclear import receptor [Trebouxia sp. C0006]
MDDQHSEVAAQRLVQAISTLHQQATSSTERAAANAWLESFEQNAVAWQVCVELLQGTGQPYPALLYAAHTLRNNIRKQTQSLAPGTLPALRDSLANGINRHSAELQPVSLQLCIAMSALVLQWTEWEDVLQYLGCRLTASNMLLLLEYLPQEPSDPVYEKILSGSSAYEWEAQSQYRVRPWSQEVIAWLTQVKLEELASSASQARCRQLNCFAAWVRLGAIFEAETPRLDQLIQLAFQLITSENEGMLCLACISIYDLCNRL